ncbi:multidrug efflux MFS transporter Bmr [Bacillus mojavensis]|jgi:DHA1 family multidrug resistance protein-like MFS transporter|uniref:Multidrug efflux MFS transporter Bmr n=1 Tax=Bacillus mojavensis TaxID=72360 RepID=A0AAP3CSF6_BACMO|nr:multidrug efflux MFS transporter Bmr [Bacillus mojavensis]MCY8104187.1 multidrug efflux MFS transporter Bmr [Bacillus mojavensis]MCY8480361.1 multidrug efflux MFS transporter Bmr [Bacillus mojavensis]MCY8509373.1 multidrug efflux MFS transporter Bmr [Bacillus mojavensis]MCY9091201.1 multidrug efflux MFS transporter Bmr [Bacillus mojavensis]MCY9189534.1 multidrug efflux MFS transporter Bmr [Bacillus mojavensis]
MKKQNITLAILLTNLFIAFLGIGLVIPVTPAIMNELHLSGTAVGYMVACFAVTQLIVSPIAGRWVDRFGRKIMIVIGLLFFSVSEFLFGIGKTVDILFISRMLGGISAAFIMPGVTAFIADITTVKTRPKALGYMSAAISTGFIIGPGIGGFLAEIHSRLPFYFAAAFALIAAILSMLTLREPERNPENEKIEGQKTGFKRIFAPMYFIAFLIILISSFGLASFESLFALFVDHKFGFTASDIAILITGGAIVGAITQVVLFDRFTRWFGEIRLIRYSLILSTSLVFLLTIVNSYAAILLVTFTVFVGFDLMRPAVTTYLSKIAGNEQGFAGGMNSMFTSIGNVFGPIIGGMLFDIDLNYPFYFATVALAIGIALTIAWKAPAHIKASM